MTYSNPTASRSPLIAHFLAQRVTLEIAEYNLGFARAAKTRAHYLQGLELLGMANHAYSSGTLGQKPSDSLFSAREALRQNLVTTYPEVKDKILNKASTVKPVLLAYNH